MSVQEFRDHEIARLERSGWAANAPLREVLDVAGLRPPAQVVAERLDETADSGAAGAGGGGGSTGGRWERPSARSPACASTSPPSASPATSTTGCSRSRTPPGSTPVAPLILVSVAASVPTWSRTSSTPL